VFYFGDLFRTVSAVTSAPQRTAGCFIWCVEFVWRGDLGAHSNTASNLLDEDVMATAATGRTVKKFFYRDFTWPGRTQSELPLWMINKILPVGIARSPIDFVGKLLQRVRVYVVLQVTDCFGFAALGLFMLPPVGRAGFIFSSDWVEALRLAAQSLCRAPFAADLVDCVVHFVEVDHGHGGRPFF
jgi:hypothetical protein